MCACRATSPKDLPTDDATAIGISNDNIIHNAAQYADFVVCAWGVNAQAYRAQQVMTILRGYGPVFALKLTKDRHPSHPLYLSKDLKPVLLENKL